jgi:penicillin amidase
VGSEAGTAGYLASLSLDRARNWNEFLETMGRWKVPAENLVYADADGNIGWVAAGLAPVRSAGTGLLPVPGAAGHYEWTGFLPVSALPQSFNPARGFIATANHDILPANYPHMLGYEWGAPFRYERIAERLAVMPRATVRDFEGLQTDVTSVAARRIIGWLKDALDAPGIVIESDAVYSADMLSKWDANLSADSAAAALYELWVPLVTKAAIAATASSPGERAYYGTNPGIDTTVRLLANLDPARRAWVMTGTALVDAWTAAEQKLGRDEKTWSWGRLHRTRFQHPLATTPERQALFNLGARPRGGDATTPNATGNGEWETHGASYREVIDVGEWDRSVTINVPGESGQPGSPYYGNLYPLWSAGQYHPMVFSRAAVEKAAAHRLRLVPDLAKQYRAHLTPPSNLRPIHQLLGQQ